MKKTRAHPAKQKKMHFVSMKLKPVRKADPELNDELLAELRQAQRRANAGEPCISLEEMMQKYGIK